jgi:hypothetical protein
VNVPEKYAGNIVAAGPDVAPLMMMELVVVAVVSDVFVPVLVL